MYTLQFRNKSMKEKGNKLRPEEIQYIRENCFSSSDEQMAEYLNRDIRTVARARKNLGVKKGTGGRIKTMIANDPNVANHPNMIHASQTLTDNERKEFFKTQLTNTLYYETLQAQFSKEELDFYLEEWSSLCVQFEDIVATEKRQIDEFIKAEINGNRLLKNIKIVEDEIKKLQDEIEKYRKDHDMPNDTDAQEKDSAMLRMLNSMNGVSGAMSNDYQKNVNLRSELLANLNSRRKDRVDQLRKAGTTFSGLVMGLRDRQTREVQGRHMELVRMAKEKKKAEWRKPIKFLDSVDDCILMDDKSELPQKEVVRLDKSILFEKYRNLENQQILVVENDITRVQFFQDAFLKSKITTASNASKAIDRLKENKYDLICLDYDLGLDSKGDEVADYLKVSDSIAEVLIHSNNEEGARKIKETLKGRSAEIFSFNNLFESIGDKNA